jgi:hypothetical protein
MKNLIVIALVLLLAGAAAADEHPAPEAPTLADLSWLAGCWAAVGGEPGSGETWTVADDGVLRGVGRFVKDGVAVATETMEIRESASGELEFIAAPPGQDPTAFTLTEVVPGEAVFENPDHDFPQRISYRRVDEDRLEATADGEVAGETKVLEFAFERVDCEKTGP